MDTMKPDDERTATDERIAENRQPAMVLPATRNSGDCGPDGLPLGISNDRRSPLDFLTPGQTPTSSRQGRP